MEIFRGRKLELVDGKVEIDGIKSPLFNIEEAKDYILLTDVLLIAEEPITMLFYKSFIVSDITRSIIFSILLLAAHYMSGIFTAILSFFVLVVPNEMHYSKLTLSLVGLASAIICFLASYLSKKFSKKALIIMEKMYGNKRTN